MPTPIEIETITASFGKQYGVDIPKIRKDAQRLREIINQHHRIDGDSKIIFSNTVTCDPTADCAVIPNLETFEIDDIAIDPRLFVSCVEQNLDESARYAEICLQIRRQYGEMAKARNDIRFKFEEFLRLDLVHQEEVEAGLYELPLHQASADNNALVESIASLTEQVSKIEILFAEGEEPNKPGSLSKRAEIPFIEASAKIARATANDSKDDMEDQSNIITDYRKSLDNATWTQSRLATSGSLAQQNKRLKAAQEKVEYLTQDVGFRIHRAEISRQLAWLQVNEHARTDSILNFNQRLESLKTLFETNLRLLVQRVRSLRDGLKIYYGIDTPEFIATQGKILDEVSVWLVSSQDALSKYKRAQRLVVWSRATENPISLMSDMGNGVNTFEVEFVFSAASLPAGVPLLRGVAFELIGTYKRPVTLSVTPPQEAIPFRDSPVLFSRIGTFTPGYDLKAQHSDLFWNGSASGSWKIKGALNKGSGEVEAVIIHLWFSLE